MNPSTYAAIAGLISHLAYFRKGEHHMYSNRYILATISSVIIGTICIHYLDKNTWTNAVFTASILTSYYFTGLFSSLLIYRTTWHPLNKFPGPFGARISALWFSSQLAARDAHKQLHRLHGEYGPIVRIGPSDLSIITPEAVQKIYGPSSRCSKGPWYDLSSPSYALQSYRDRATHDKGRRVWSTAFGDKMLRGYEERTRVYRQKLVDRFELMEGEPVNVTKWFNLYMFDVMGDLAFGKGFQCLERGEEHWVVDVLVELLRQIGLYIPSWMWPVLKGIPMASRDFWNVVKFCAAKLEERMKTQEDVPDIIASLIAPLKGRKPTAEEWDLLCGEARLILVAGSDTSAISLAAIFYELVRHPVKMDKLRAELAPYLNDGEISQAQLTKLDHLNGVINEALRLHPPVPGAMWRKTPSEGIEIGEVHVPGDVGVFSPQYVVGRSELSYELPTEFIPERWYSKPHLIKDKSAFAPFSAGPYNCIGKPLALSNLRATVAQLIMKFDVQFSPGENGLEFTEKSRDLFAMSMGSLNLVFQKRPIHL